ncbi:hypothetical protein SAMN04489725_1452 [Alicyclobacillus hesperidum]|nr:hypothetical protein SAMN04489725_1452 [Alicyclobacillus hesperidum]
MGSYSGAPLSDLSTGVCTRVVFVYGTMRKGQPNRQVMEPHLVASEIRGMGVLCAEGESQGCGW